MSTTRNWTRVSIPSIRSVHGGDLSRDMGPFELSLHGFRSLGLEVFIPFHQLVDKPQMGLDNDIEPTSTHEATSNEVSILHLDLYPARAKSYYARGKLRPFLAMTSAMQMVADRLTPTRQ